MERFISQLRALPTWQRYALLVFIPSVLLVYLWFMFVSPIMDELNRLRVEVRTISAEIERIKESIKPEVLAELRKQEADLKAEYEKKYSELTGLVGEIPTEKDLGVVLRSIGQIAKKSGVVVLGMQASVPQKTSYYISQDGERKVVKEVQQQQQQQQAPDQTRAQQAQQEGVAFLKSDLKISLIGEYRQVRNFLTMLRSEGVISYPHSLNLIAEGNKTKAEITIFLLIKEVGYEKLAINFDGWSITFSTAFSES